MSLSLERPGNYHSEDGARFICKFNKARVKASELPYIKDYEFQLMQKEDRYKWTYRDDAADKKRQVLKMLDEKMPQKDIADELGVTKQYVSKVKSQATRDGILSKDGRLTQSGFQEIHKESTG
jgi:predicted restriction endonuclease